MAKTTKLTKPAEQRTPPGMPKRSDLYEKALEYIAAKRMKEGADKNLKDVATELVIEFKAAKQIEIFVTTPMNTVKRVRYDHAETDKIAIKNN
jgi:hypothetical protein